MARDMEETLLSDLKLFFHKFNKIPCKYWLNNQEWLPIFTVKSVLFWHYYYSPVYSEAAETRRGA
jgi:hypothetical protein